MNATALLADDEEASRARLRAALRHSWPELRIVAEAANGIDAWDLFLEREPQVCFLDVRMPGFTGIEVAQRIGERVPVVFIATHGDRSVTAFDNDAIDCLLKPIDPHRLAPLLARVQARLAALPASRGAAWAATLARLAQQVRRPAWLDTIDVGPAHEPLRIAVNDVVFFESDAHATRVVHSGGDALIRTPLKELTGRLDPASFVQVHRFVIVNRRHLAGSATLPDGHLVATLHGRADKLPVGRHFEPLFHPHSPP